MSIFLERTADVPSFRILEYFIEARETDHAISDVIEATGMARSTFYAAWPQLLRNEYVRQTRIVGKTKLFALSSSNPSVQLYVKLFDTALRERRRRVAA